MRSLRTRSDAVVAADRDGIILLLEPGGAERIFGHTAGGRSLTRSLDLIVPERLRQRHWDGYRHTMATGQSRYGEGEMLSVPALRRDGATISVEFTIGLLTSRVSGAWTGIIAMTCATSRRASRSCAACGASSPRRRNPRDDRCHPPSVPHHRPFDPFDREFAELLGGRGRLVADVRRVPRSRTNPQYNRMFCPAAVGRSGSDTNMSRRSAACADDPGDVSPDLNGFWQNAELPQLRGLRQQRSVPRGLVRLREFGASKRCAVMCAEAVWWRCHRRIITDYLLAAGETVFHILCPITSSPRA